MLKLIEYKPKFEDKANIQFISDYLDYSIVPIIKTRKEKESIKPILNLLINDLESWAVA